MSQLLHECGVRLTPLAGGSAGKASDFGDLATRGRAEAAVLKLLARHGQPGAT